MWHFLTKRLESGSHGSKLYVAKKLPNGYIIAIRAVHQKLLEIDQLLEEWKLILVR